MKQFADIFVMLHNEDATNVSTNIWHSNGKLKDNVPSFALSTSNNLVVLQNFCYKTSNLLSSTTHVYFYNFYNFSSFISLYKSKLLQNQCKEINKRAFSLYSRS